MRIALNPNDRGYIENAAAAIVTVDGNPITDWVIADDHLQAVMLQNNTLVRGKVEITLPEVPRYMFGKKKHG